MGKRRRTADGIDNALQLLRWPVALLLPVTIVPTAGACLSLVQSMVFAPGPILPFSVGLLAYLALWIATIRRWRTTWLSTLEHELTHALFALLTFHPVVEIRTTWRSGGQMRYRGKGNWLITLSPYFFPTICMLLLSVLALVPVLFSQTGEVLVGAAFGYHLTSTVRETHAGQSDLREAGYLFSLLVLPGLFLLTHGVVLAWCYGGNVGLAGFLRLVWKNLNSLFP